MCGVKRAASLDARAIELVGLLDAMMRRLIRQARISRDAQVPLTPLEVRVIEAIGDARDSRMGELARRMVLGMSSLTSVVDRLVAKGLVARERSEEDRRVVRVGLTAGGQKVHAECRRRRLRLAYGMLHPLSRAEQDLFVELIRKIGRGTENASRRAGSRKGGGCKS